MERYFTWKTVEYKLSASGPTVAKLEGGGLDRTSIFRGG